MNRSSKLQRLFYMAYDSYAWGWGARSATANRVALALLTAIGVFLAAPARGQEHQSPQALASAEIPGATDPHAAHRAAMQAPSFQVVKADYSIPDVSMQDQDGRVVALRQLLSGEQPVIVNFIFTSCTTICPVMTATMLQMQRELDDAAVKPMFVSISIDPDYDDVATLAAYARRFGADWTFLTGEREDVLDVLKAFAAWRGNKSNHAAVTLFRAAGAKRWTRIEGLASARQLADVWNSGLT